MRAQGRRRSRPGPGWVASKSREYLEVAVRRLHKARHVILELLVDVLEGGWDGDAAVDAEAEAVRLPRPVVRVLPEDHDAHVARRRKVEAREDVLRLGEDAFALALLLDLGVELAHIALRELLLQHAAPRAVRREVLQHREVRQLRVRRRVGGRGGDGFFGQLGRLGLGGGRVLVRRPL
eukprot:2045484-Prymnesium_polylepis.1